MNESVSNHSVVVVSENQVSSEFIEGEIIVLDVYEGEYYVLNPVGARIWSLIQDPKRVDDLLDVLLNEYEVEPGRCRGEVLHLLRDLAERKLIKVSDDGDR